MNTASQNIKPFYSQVSIANIKDGLKLFACQTSSCITILKCENINNWKQYQQIDIKDAPSVKIPIGHFEFLPPPSENLDSYSKEMLIGYRNGLILHINYMENTIINKFNQYETDDGDKYISVQTILFSPKPNTGFYVLFSNNLLMQYLLEKTGENQDFINEKNRIVDKKKPGKTKGKSPTANGSFEVKLHRFEGMSELNFTSGRNLDKNAKNPTNFYFFDCPAISEGVFHQSPHFKKMGSDVIFAFVGYDGYLRIFDLEQKKALYSFKSNYGGFNNLSFNKYGDLVALSGHDDNIVVLNLSNYGYVTIEGHKSFISSVILKDIDEKFIRLYAGSMDGSVSITDINTFEIGLKNQLDTQVVDKKKSPIKIFFSDFKSRRILAKNISFACNEGVGNVIFHDPHFLSSGYDGGIQVWSIENEKKEKEEETEKDDNEKTEKNGKMDKSGKKDKLGKSDEKSNKTEEKISKIEERLEKNENGEKKSKKKASEDEKVPEEKDGKYEEIVKKKNNYMSKDEIYAGMERSRNKK